MINDIYDVIKNRRSVRTFKNEELKEEDLNKIENYINNHNQKNEFFKANIRYVLLEAKKGTNVEKLGTYGIIKDAKHFIGVVVNKNNMPLVEVGYNFEDIILYLTSIGIGTCWIGGTFNKEQFVQASNLADDENLVIVCPIGYENDKRSTREKLFRAVGGFNKRKDFKEVFFNKTFYNPLDKDIDKDYVLPLEMVRIAPSAVNKQPWRIIYKDNIYHFYKIKEMNKKIPYDITLVDLGIAAYHFNVSCNKEGLKGHFSRVDKTNVEAPSDLEYLFSWIKE